MDAFMTFVEGLLDFFDAFPPLLLGLVAAIGLIAQKKRVDEIIRGGFMAALGVFIIIFSVDILVGSIAPINDLYATIDPDPDLDEPMGEAAYLGEYGAQIGLAMLLGFVLHILIAAFTKVKTIFLTGHFLFWMPFIFVAVGVGVGFPTWALVIWGGVLSALYWSFMPYLLRPYSRAVIGDDSFTLGHPSAILALISGTIAKYVGNKENSTEDIDLPKGLGFFREVPIMGAIVIFIVYIVTGLTVGDGFAGEGMTELPLVAFAFEQALMFGAGIIILLQGVRIFVNEIVPAFEGISSKIIKGAQPAYDAPIFFNYKPNAVIIGFIIAFVTSTVLIVIVNQLDLFVVMLLPLVIPSFFECGAASVMAEGQGGIRGAVIGTFVAAIVMVFLLGISLFFFRETIQDWMLIFGGNDMSLWGSVTGGIVEFFDWLF